MNRIVRWSVPLLYEDLHNRILRGQLRPGEALSETKIAEQYGLSRTPIRQVFQRLAEVGFLSIVPQVGTFVAPIDIGAIRDAQFMRETIECGVARQAAEAATPETARLLQGHLDAQMTAISAGDHFGFFQSDEAMHRTMMEIAGHPHIWGFLAPAKLQLDRLRYLSLESPDWLKMIFSQHEALIARIAARDAEGAVSVMREHLRTAFAAIERIAQTHGEFFADETPGPARMPPAEKGRRQRGW